MKLKSLLQEASQEIERHEAEIAAAHLLNVKRLELHAKVIADDLITSDFIADLKAIIQRRKSGEPLQYILGSAPFRYLELKVGPGVLIPRPETEMLVDLALHQISKLPEPVSVIDAGSGSGAIAISIVQETLGKKDVRVIAVEKSAAAAKYLKENIAKYEFDIRVVEGDIATSLLDVKADLFLANPPYIPATLRPQLPVELNAEPADALFAGIDGMADIEIFIASAKKRLKLGGFFLMEHFEDQAPAIEKLLTPDFEQIQVVKDMTGRIRFTKAILKGCD